MSKKILVTGGLGFIGSHIVDKLILAGHDVRILDNMEHQVHHGKTPSYTNKQAEVVIGDVRDSNTISMALEDIDVVFHEAAAVGVSQSMYQISKYVDVNTLGTAKLLEEAVGKHNIKKIIIASSFSIYGEGTYKCDSCGIVYPKRSEETIEKGDWKIYCSCGKILMAVPTAETKPTYPDTVYAISKRDQEDLALSVGKSYGIPTTALRYFNVYGPRQSMNNPYTGVCAIFSARIKNDKPPIIFEDGMQTRDFVSVHDIADANILAMESSKANYEAFNVGTGTGTPIIKVARTISRLYGKKIEPQVENSFRKGDTRHCYADIAKISRLGFKPRVNLSDGLKELFTWGDKEHAFDQTEKAIDELRSRGLTK